MKKLLNSFVAGFLAIASTSALALESYSPKVDIDAKTIVIRGSDTVEVMLKDWMRDFSRYHPHVKFDIVAEGSSKAVKALMAGEADLGPMSRKMKRKESRAFRSQFGYKPTRVTVAADALAVVVNPRNPIAALSLEDLDALFSSSRKCGGRKDVQTWGDVNVKGGIEKQPPNLVGRNSASGTYSFFKSKALCRGDYKDGIAEIADNLEILKAIKTDPAAIGYVGLGFVDKGVKTISLPARYGSSFVAPSLDPAKIINYPLSRHLYIYLNLEPDGQLDKTTAEFFRFIYSKQGQATVTKKGFIALADHAVKSNFRELNITDK